MFWRSGKSACCIEAWTYSFFGKAGDTERVRLILMHILGFPIFAVSMLIYARKLSFNIHNLNILNVNANFSFSCLFFNFRKSVSLPIKWFAVGQCWRYERMTRGRRREHYQWNMDIIGVPGVMVCAAWYVHFLKLWIVLFVVKCFMIDPES